ncbi:MAG: hypothetical protein ABW068_16250, partial [Candidatus Thiodiazotropha sp.]
QALRVVIFLHRFSLPWKRSISDILSRQVNNSVKTHQEYIDGFKSKQRISFKRKIKKINEAFPGKVEIHRIDYADDLDYLTLSAK